MGCILAYIAVVVFGMDGLFIPKNQLKYMCMVSKLFKFLNMFVK